MTDTKFCDRIKRGIRLGTVGLSALLACLTSVAYTQPADQQVTFTRDIAPILQNKCESCHRDGSIAPMSLTGGGLSFGSLHLPSDFLVTTQWLAGCSSTDFDPGTGRLDIKYSVVSSWLTNGSPSNASLQNGAT